MVSSTQDAFKLYHEDENNTIGVLKRLCVLKGIGPATASLLFAVHDPVRVVFFSDECYKWLVDDEKVLRYSDKEFVQLLTEARALAQRLDVELVQIEKVAFVIMNEPRLEQVTHAQPFGKSASSTKKDKSTRTGKRRQTSDVDSTLLSEPPRKALRRRNVS